MSCPVKCPRWWCGIVFSMIDAFDGGPMRLRAVFVPMAVFSFCVFFQPAPARAETSTSIALSGLVSSVEEGQMEGVLVSAKKGGSTITVTVVSDAQGRYRFPLSKLPPGQYALHIRAVG